MTLCLPSRCGWRAGGNVCVRPERTSPERKRQTREIRTDRPPGTIDLTMAIDLLIAVLLAVAEPGDSGPRK
jgi:hypothetical protein